MGVFPIFKSVQMTPNRAAQIYIVFQKVNSGDVIKDYFDFAKAVDEGDVLALTSFDDVQISPIPEEIKKTELQNYSQNCQKCKKTLKKKLRMHELPPDLQNEQRCKNRVAARRCRQQKRSRLESLEKVSF